MKQGEAKRVELLHRGAAKALKEAVAKAIADHKAAGVPAAIWRDGKVVHIGASRLKKSRK